MTFEDLPATTDTSMKPVVEPPGASNLPMQLLPVITGAGCAVFALYSGLVPLVYGDQLTVIATSAGVSAALLCVLITATAIMTTLQAEKYLRWIAVSKHLLPMFQIFVRSMICCALWLAVSLLALVSLGVKFLLPILIILAAMSLAYTAQVIHMLAIVGEIIFTRIQTEARAAVANKRIEVESGIGPPGAF